MSVHKLAILLLVPGTFALSQTNTGRASSASRFEAFGGYTFRSNQGSIYSPISPYRSGFNAGLDVRIYRPLSLVGEISVFPFSCNCPGAGSPTERTLLFGPRYSFPVPQSFRIEPFAGVLFGTSTYSYGNFQRDVFAFGIQGGLDYRIAPHFAVRGVGAYVHSTLPRGTDYETTNSEYDRGQFDIDLVYRF